MLNNSTEHVTDTKRVADRRCWQPEFQRFQCASNANFRLHSDLSF
jgi:hypothetical protein